MENKEIMLKGIKEAFITMNKNFGGPFGAVITKDDKIIAIASNTVLKDNDPTAHAEVNAIRKACKILNSYNLKDCVLYATGYPCPMCLSAIIWANIPVVYYGCTPEDAEKIGFRDAFIYDFIDNLKSNKNTLLNIKQLCREDCLKLFEEYNLKQKFVY